MRRPPAEKEPQSDATAVDPRIVPQCGQRRVDVVAGHHHDGVVVDEAVLEHPADQARLRQQRAVRPVRRPLARTSRQVGAERSAVDHQYGGGRCRVRQVEVERAERVGRDRLVREDERAKERREV
jgi:hypothetical protein